VGAKPAVWNSAAQLAERFGIELRTVSNVLERNGVQPAGFASPRRTSTKSSACTDRVCRWSPRPKRRTFPAEYKLRIVAAYDAAPNGEKGAILYRERLYHFHIIEWRAARDAGARATALELLGKRSALLGAGPAEPARVRRPAT